MMELEEFTSPLSRKLLISSAVVSLLQTLEEVWSSPPTAVHTVFNVDWQPLLCLSSDECAHSPALMYSKKLKVPHAAAVRKDEEDLQDLSMDDVD
jgi:hypothetical protein